jgi:hypothetical protein
VHDAAATITVAPLVSEQVMATVVGSRLSVQVGLALFPGEPGAVITGAAGAVVSYG